MSSKATFGTSNKGFAVFPSPMPPIKIDADGLWCEMRLPRSYFGHLSAQQCLSIAKQMADNFGSYARWQATRHEILAKYGINQIVLTRILTHYRRVWSAKEEPRR